MKSIIVKTHFFISFFILMLFCVHAETTHIVEKGETFYSISRKYNIPVKTLYSNNHLNSNSILKIGQKLVISLDESNQTNDKIVQSKKEYTVMPGDTLYGISRKIGTNVSTLREMNKLDETYILKIGQVILIPEKELLSSEKEDLHKPTEQETTPAELPQPVDPRKYDSNKKGDKSLKWPIKASDVVYVAGKISGVSITSESSEDVLAIKSGTVLYSGLYRGFGQVVFIKSDSGYIYVYSGLDTIVVNNGQKIKCNEKLGNTAIDALSGTNRISLMVYKNGKVIDPATAPRG